MRRKMLFLAALVLVVLLVGAAISLRDEIALLLVNASDIVTVGIWAIYFFSTIEVRLFLFAASCVFLWAGFLLTRSLPSPLLRYLLPVLIVFTLFLGLYHIFPQRHPTVGALFLALMAAVMGLAHHLDTRGGRAGIASRSLGTWLPRVIMISALGVLQLNSTSLVSLARRLHAEEAVWRFAKGDFNGLAIDTQQSRLFASGHGTNHLLAYNVRALEQPPRRSEVEVYWAEGFDYSPIHQELYVFKQDTRTLLILDATTLALKRSVPDIGVTPGDAAIVWDSHTDSIVIVSENGEELPPFAVVNRTTGRLSYTLKRCGGRPCDPGTILLHPRKPVLYMSFWEGLLAYDTKLRKTVASFKTGNRWLARMAMTPSRDELLVAAAVSSAVLRFDAETLEPKGRIGTVFGVRTLATDPGRNLLLAGSLVTGWLDVINLETNSRVAHYYIGPWLRTIVLDTSAGLAYISSIEGIFRVNYGARLPQ